MIGSWVGKMINNPTLILVGRRKGGGAFTTDLHWDELTNTYFNLEHYQTNKTYDKDVTFLISPDPYLDPEIRNIFKDKKVIIDLTWEGKYAKWGEVYNNKEPHHTVMYGSYSEKIESGAIFAPMFWWYNTALANISKGHDNYVPNRNYSKKFFMPMGGKRKWRDQVVSMLDPLLNDAYWSYQKRNKALPGDEVVKHYDIFAQNPMWYNDTCFSVVAESINTQQITNISPIFLTEKIFKPFSGQQPYMVIAAAGTLKFLLSQGFETYDNIFNELYDVETDFNKKMAIIVENIQNYEKVPHSEITLEKIKHNFNKFYNMADIVAGFEKEIVNPICEYINSN
jgi:hypothetical protein